MQKIPSPGTVRDALHGVVDEPHVEFIGDFLSCARIYEQKVTSEAEAVKEETPTHLYCRHNGLRRRLCTLVHHQFIPI